MDSKSDDLIGLGVGRSLPDRLQSYTTLLKYIPIQERHARDVPDLKSLTDFVPTTTTTGKYVAE